MLLTKKFLEEYFHQEEHLFYMCSENDCIDAGEFSFPYGYLSLLIPVSGSIEFKTQLLERSADPLQVLLFVQDEPIQISGMSRDFSCVGIIFSKKLWNHTLLNSHPYLSLASFNPSLAITVEQKELLIEFLEQIRYLKESGKADSNPVVINLILGLLFYVGRFYEKWLSTLPKQSNFKVVPKFMFLLFNNYRVHKEVTFYADQLHMSKSQFSKVIKATTGMSAYKCIERYLLLKARALLRNTQKSVKEIAFELNFRDDSHFCKFFRRHTGQSPQEFRTESLMGDPMVFEDFESVKDLMP